MGIDIFAVVPLIEYFIKLRKIHLIPRSLQDGRGKVQKPSVMTETDIIQLRVFGYVILPYPVPCG